MDIKQESDDLIEDENLELVFIKQEKDDNPPTEYLQEPNSSGIKHIIDDTDENCDLVQINNTKKGLPLDRKSMKKRSQLTYRVVSIGANVKDEIEIVDHELKEEFDEIVEHVNLFNNIDDSKICSNQLVVSDHMCYFSKTDNNHVECEICSKVSQQRRGVNRLCQIDGKSLESECCLKKHLCVYTDEKLEMESSSAFTAKGHLNGTHTDEKLFKCNICSKCFPRKSQLMSHLRTHTGEKPFKCNVCTKSFSRGHTLKCHLRIHTGEKPFKCDVCTKSFLQESYLKYHYLTHKILFT